MRKRFAYGKGNAVSTTVETLHVHVRAEETGLSILVLVSLHTLKALKGVMKDDGGRVQLKLSILLDLGVAPTLTSLPLDRQHVVGKSLAKDQLGIGLELLLLGRLLNRELGSIKGGQLGAVEAGESGGGEDLGAVGGGGGGGGGLNGLAHCSLDKHCDERRKGGKCTREERGGKMGMRMKDLKEKKKKKKKEIGCGEEKESEKKKKRWTRRTAAVGVPFLPFLGGEHRTERVTEMSPSERDTSVSVPKKTERSESPDREKNS